MCLFLWEGYPHPLSPGYGTAVLVCSPGWSKRLNWLSGCSPLQDPVLSSGSHLPFYSDRGSWVVPSTHTAPGPIPGSPFSALLVVLPASLSQSPHLSLCLSPLPPPPSPRTEYTVFEYPRSAPAPPSHVFFSGPTHTWIPCIQKEQVALFLSLMKASHLPLEWQLCVFFCHTLVSGGSYS